MKNKKETNLPRPFRYCSFGIFSSSRWHFFKKKN